MVKKYVKENVKNTKNTAVLVVGDLNIDYKTEIYQKMIEILGKEKTRNIQQEIHGNVFQKTFGGNLVDPSHRTIDYALILSGFDEFQFLPLCVQSFHVLNDLDGVRNLSDHYPLTFSLLPS